MKKNNYIYPAIITYYDDNIGIEFPDLPGCITNADNLDEVPKVSKEALALHIYSMEEDNFEIPEPSLINNLSLENNQIPFLVDVYMPLFRDSIANTTTKTTVTMPQWLKTLAEENKINFSQVLQNALKEHLNYYHR